MAERAGGEVPPWQEATFEPTARAAVEARRFVRRLVPAGDRADLAALLVSELVTNGVRHARTRLLLRVRPGEPLRVEVRDDLPVPPIRAVPGAEDGSGRGLQILEALATRWGVEVDEDGKTVWFEL